VGGGGGGGGGGHGGVGGGGGGGWGGIGPVAGPIAGGGSPARRRRPSRRRRRANAPDARQEQHRALDRHRGHRGGSCHRVPGGEVPRVGRSPTALPPGLVHGAGSRAPAKGRPASARVGRVWLASTARPPRHGPRSLPSACGR